MECFGSTDQNTSTSYLNWLPTSEEGNAWSDGYECWDGQKAEARRKACSFCQSSPTGIAKPKPVILAQATFVISLTLFSLLCKVQITSVITFLVRAWTRKIVEFSLVFINYNCRNEAVTSHKSSISSKPPKRPFNIALFWTKAIAAVAVTDLKMLYLIFNTDLWLHSSITLCEEITIFSLVTIKVSMEKSFLLWKPTTD